MADGGVTHLAPLGEGQEAVVCLTGHAFIASRLGPNELSDLAPDGFGGALHPGILLEAQRRMYRVRFEPLIELDKWLEPYRREWADRPDSLERHLDEEVI
jgi:hypothetical protein